MAGCAATLSVMKGHAAKTNAVRLLDAAGVRYRLVEYAVDPADLRAETVAAKLGLPAGQVWKTLVTRGERTGVAFALLPGDRELDLKALARLAGDRKVETVPLKEVQPLTGYVRGGVTPLGARHDDPVFVDGEIELHAEVSISAGVRGTQVLLAPGELLRVLGPRARLGAISRPKGPGEAPRG